MEKTYEEMATEITVAWINAVGNACAAGTFSGDWLKVPTVQEMYETTLNTIVESVKEIRK